VTTGRNCASLVIPASAWCTYESSDRRSHYTLHIMHYLCSNSMSQTLTVKRSCCQRITVTVYIQEVSDQGYLVS